MSSFPNEGFEMSEVERLTLENFFLKLGVLERRVEDYKTELSLLRAEQKRYITTLREKYSIDAGLDIEIDLKRSLLSVIKE